MRLTQVLVDRRVRHGAWVLDQRNKLFGYFVLFDEFSFSQKITKINS